MNAGAGAGQAETLSAVLAGGRQSAIALVSPEDEQSLTYADLTGRVESLARLLAGAGVRRGDRVAMALPNGPECVELLLAIMWLGAAAAPLNSAYTESEFAFYLGDIAPRLMVTLPGQPRAAISAAAGAGVTALTLITSPGAPARLEADGQAVRPAAPAGTAGPDDIGIVLHTSGTTSRPKQVPLRQRNLMASVRTVAAHYGLGPADVSFAAMPLFHIHGLVASTFAALSAGGTVVVPRRFTPQRFWRQARDYRATWLSAGPTMHTMILDRIDADGPPASLRFTRSCSSALSPALLERAEAAYGVPMLEAYGMTEASHQMASNPLPPAARVPGSVGVPTGTEIGITDTGGQPQPAGTPGEVVIRGPGVMSGYVANPQATAEAFWGDWFRTGDRGVLRDGYLYLEGRIKEMILRGGENISPAEIEQVLLAHPAVGDAVCFGLPDEKYGELPAAAVTLSQDTPAADLTGFCRERLAAFKVPTRVWVLPEIPRTATGKVQRRRMADVVAGKQPAQ
jgi:acyl-CoA synthetase (AMP-forming)/AMP-acid ligase II